MEKTRIETFIKKYHLGGIIEQARWISDTKTLKTTTMSSDKKLMTTVEMANFDAFPNIELGIHDTDKLKIMLASLGDQVTFDLTTDEADVKRITAMVVSSAGREFNYVTADIDVIPKTPAMKVLPMFDVEIKMTETFIASFLAGKAALPEADMFTLVMNKKTGKLNIVLGYSTINNNRFSVNDVETETGKDKVTQPINFNAKWLKEIITANGEVKNAVLKVSEKGLATIDFSSGDYKVQYFMIKMDSEE